VPAIFVLLIVVVLQAPYREPVTYTKEEALALGQQLIAEIDPARRENVYMPPLLREKIAWVFAEFEAPSASTSTLKRATS
jgi:hypothetical protein